MGSSRDKLSGGDLRSIGRSNEVAKEITADPRKFAEVFDALLDPDPVIRMRAADAIEKATSRQPEMLQPYKRRILREIAAINQKEVRWHIAQLLPRLSLSLPERDLALSVLFKYLEDRSSIVRTFAMQALADFAHRDSRLEPRILPLLKQLALTGSPAMRSRGRRLLAQFA